MVTTYEVGEQVPVNAKFWMLIGLYHAFKSFVIPTWALEQSMTDPLVVLIPYVMDW